MLRWIKGLTQANLCPQDNWTDSMGEYSYYYYISLDIQKIWSWKTWEFKWNIHILEEIIFMEKIALEMQVSNNYIITIILTAQSKFFVPN